ncbi:DUF5134 domain-containing protein, partial [Streptomyces sp. ms191]|uniref:DUF5134 domain-containing protein n=1 Tax=Streptomyces sp. ms191 TaxID=1827978 RepID=UPI0011CE0A44
GHGAAGTGGIPLLTGALLAYYSVYGHGAAGTGGIPLLTGALLAYYSVYVLRAGARLVPVAAPAGAAPVLWAERPEFTLVCRLSMALAMLAMLVTL